VTIASLLPFCTWDPAPVHPRVSLGVSFAVGGFAGRPLRLTGAAVADDGAISAEGATAAGATADICDAPASDA
jgi:hypothetical protein